ncbi:MAG TPA: MaoC family dehydratase [Burkholderiales bacterium]|jgi:acyl dehydratase
MNSANANEVQAAGTVRYLEDFKVGERWLSAPTQISEAEIVAYGLANDPQPMHTDPAAAKEGLFGGLIASGWQIAALSMRLFIQAGGYGKTPVVGLGIDGLRWLKPVRPGDTLTVEREVVEITRSEKQPDKGTIRTCVNVRNQAGDVVMTLFTLGRVHARPS